MAGYGVGPDGSTSSQPAAGSRNYPTAGSFANRREHSPSDAVLGLNPLSTQYAATGPRASAGNELFAVTYGDPDSSATPVQVESHVTQQSNRPQSKSGRKSEMTEDQRRQVWFQYGTRPGSSEEKWAFDQVDYRSNLRKNIIRTAKKGIQDSDLYQSRGYKDWPEYAISGTPEVYLTLPAMVDKLHLELKSEQKKDKLLFDSARYELRVEPEGMVIFNALIEKEPERTLTKIGKKEKWVRTIKYYNPPKCLASATYEVEMDSLFPVPRSKDPTRLAD